MPFIRIMIKQKVPQVKNVKDRLNTVINICGRRSNTLVVIHFARLHETSNRTKIVLKEDVFISTLF